MKKNMITSLALIGAMTLQGFGGLAYAATSSAEVSAGTNSQDIMKLTYNGTEIPLEPNGDFVLGGKNSHIDAHGNITYNGSLVGNANIFPWLVFTNPATTSSAVFSTIGSGAFSDISGKTYVLTYKGNELSLRKNGIFFLDGKMGNIASNGDIVYKGSLMGNIANSPDFKLTSISGSVNTGSTSADTLLNSLLGGIAPASISGSTISTGTTQQTTASDGLGFLDSLLGGSTASTASQTATDTNPYEQSLSSTVLTIANNWISQKIVSKQNSLSPDDYNNFIKTAVDRFETAKEQTTNTVKLNAINYTLYELQKLQNSTPVNAGFFDNILGTTQRSNQTSSDGLGFLDSLLGTGSTASTATTDTGSSDGLGFLDSLLN